MSLLKSPWFWASSALGLLFMNSRSKAEELSPPKPQAPSSSSPPKVVAPSQGTGGTPSGPLAPRPSPKPQAPSPSPSSTFVTPGIPKDAKVKTAFVEGRAYDVARLGDGNYLVVSRTGDAYDKFGQGGEIESGGRSPEALAQLKNDMQLFPSNLFDRMLPTGL